LGVGLEHQGRGGAVDQVVIQLGGAHLDGPLLGIDLPQVELAPVGAVQEEPVAEVGAKKQGEGNGLVEIVAVGVVVPAVASPVAVAPTPFVE